MQIIDTATALEGVADPTLRHILNRYDELIDLAAIYIIQPGDTLQALALARGWPFADWEFIIDHGGWYEAVFIISDDGFGHAVLVPDRDDIDPALLDLCRSNSQPNTTSAMSKPGNAD